MRISAVAFLWVLAYYGPWGAAIAGGLYTLNCESATGDGGGGCGTGAGAAGVGSVLGDASIGVGAVDARIGGESGAGLLGVDICRSIRHFVEFVIDVSMGNVRGRVSSARSTPFPCSFRHVLVDMMTSSSRTHTIPRCPWSMLHKNASFWISKSAPRA
jgi:hypothetical protein